MFSKFLVIENGFVQPHYQQTIKELGTEAVSFDHCDLNQAEKGDHACELEKQRVSSDDPKESENQKIASIVAALTVYQDTYNYPVAGSRNISQLPIWSISTRF